METDVKLTDLESCRVLLSDRPGERNNAIQCYSKWIENAETLVQHNGETAQSVENGEICKQLAMGYNERGFIKYQQVEFDEAIKDYTKALTYNNQLHFTFYNRGLIHYRLGRFEEAIEDMKQAIHLKTDFEPAVKCLEQAEKDKQCKNTVHSPSEGS